MGAANGVGKGRRRNDAYAELEDLTLASILKEEPVPLSTAPSDPAQLRQVLGARRRDSETPGAIRKFLGRMTADGSRDLVERLLDECDANGTSPQVLFTLLAWPHRVVLLPDRAMWLLAVVGEGDDTDDRQSSVGWVRLRDSPSEDSGLIDELDIYQLSTDLEVLRDELRLIALEQHWKPKVPADERVLLVLGPAAASHLGRDAEELEAHAAVEGVHLEVLAVPRDSSDRPWTDARNRALELEGPIASAVSSEERSAQRLLQAVHERHGNRRQITSLRSPGHDGWVFSSLLSLLGESGVLPSEQLTVLQPPGTASAARRPVRFEHKEEFLAKSGSARDFDVLEPTGRRCAHRGKVWVRMRRSGAAPKKYNGVQKYLGKLNPPGNLIRAEFCTGNGCGLVLVQYEVPAPTTDDSDSEDSASGNVLRLGRSPPCLSGIPHQTRSEPSQRTTLSAAATGSVC